MKATYRRRTDADDPRDRLTVTERQALFLEGLSREVNAACTRWLNARGISAKPFAGEYPGSKSQGQGEAAQGKERRPGGKVYDYIAIHRSPSLLHVHIEKVKSAEINNFNS